MSQQPSRGITYVVTLSATDLQRYTKPPPVHMIILWTI